jgi:hypothetical protein
MLGAFLLRRMCKVFENRSLQDEERMDQLTNQLKEARLLAEDADGKSDEVMDVKLCNTFV